MNRSTRPVHPAPSGVVDRRVLLPAMAQGKRVVHLGCVDEHLTSSRHGTGDLLHQELSKVASELIGVDISASGIELIRELIPGRYVVGDVERLGELDLPTGVDLVIAAELIEHLGSPARFLEGLRGYLLETGATAVLTTPNAYSWRHFLAIAARRPEMVHPDHRLLYSSGTLQRSLQDAGLRIDRLRVHTWRYRRAGLARLAGLVDRLLLRWQPLLAVGLIVEVSPTA